MTCPFLLPAPTLYLLLCDVYQIHGKPFYAERTPPPQLPFSAHKKQVKKRMASVKAGGWMEGENVFVWHIYVCVKQKWNKKKCGIFMLFFHMYIVFFYFLPFHLDFYI